MSNLSSSCFYKGKSPRCTHAEKSERKANSLKIGTEITSNWRPFKNIITLFPQQGIRNWGIFLIRTEDELAIKLLSQALSRFTASVSVCLYVLCMHLVMLNLSARIKINNSG